MTQVRTNPPTAAPLAKAANFLVVGLEDDEVEEPGEGEVGVGT